jgi:benzylsuccinate CoA-transferase BbsE subunit
MLSCYRIIDLTDPRAWLCGLVLAHLGAEVVMVEPPGGHDCSDLPPAWRQAYLRGRILVEGGRDEMDALIAGADAVVASGAPVDELARWRDVDEGLVTLSITPWGQTGPKAGWRASDLVLAAAGGHVILNGDADRPPVRSASPRRSTTLRRRPWSTWWRH